MDESLLLDKSFSLILTSQSYDSEDSQSVPTFLSYDNEKRTCCEGVTEDIVSGDLDATPLWGPSVSLNQDTQSDCIPSQIFSFTEAATSDCFLEKTFHQKACEHHHQEEPLGCFSEDLPCTPSDTTQDLLTDLDQTFALEKPALSSSPGMGEEGSALLFPVCSSIFHSSLTPSPTCDIKTTSAPSDSTTESSSKYRLKTFDLCVPSTSGCTDHCKLGSWWQQGTETQRASSGLLSATEPGAATTSDNKRPSLVLSQPYTYSRVHFMDFTAKQKGDNKQAENEEPAGWSGLGKASQGAIRSGRTRSRKGKRIKRT